VAIRTSVTPVDTASVTLRSRFARLLPADNGPQGIRALDGLRAVAALSVLVFHGFLIRGILLANPKTIVLGQDLTFLWYFLETGVILFFVLSGFLLFLPYAQAILDGRPLPSARRFYQRRALRILPAYWLCLAILVLTQLHSFVSKAGVKNVLVHIVLVHNLYPIFNQAIEGPFWTLAVEAQYYLLLPLIAWGIARIVGQTRSPRRVMLCILAMAGAALALREGVAVVYGYRARLHGWPASLMDGALVAVNGTQGRYLEVFAVGMLCSLLYVIVRRNGTRIRQQSIQLAGWLLFAGALAASFVLAQRVNVRHEQMLSLYYQFMQPADPEEIGGPFLIGTAYGMLVLGILFGGQALRTVFEVAPLRFIGLISYSLYLWHLPILLGSIAYFPALAPYALRVSVGLTGAALAAVAVAYASYMLIERPFLHRRQSMRQTHAIAAPGEERLVRD
jgi:peptidoglycan/LPS O-acetylase OafA/YrhL